MNVIRKKHGRRGIVAVLAAVSLTALLGIVALAIDGGLMFDEHRHAQATADAAAMAGATVLYSHYPGYGGYGPSGDAVQAALSYAAHNGYTNDGERSVVTAHAPPETGPYAGKEGYIEVVVVHYQDRFFSHIFGTGKLPVRARAVARGAWVKPGAGVLVLDYTGKATFNAQGNGAFTETGGAVIVNSNSPEAALTMGNALMIAPEFNITGGLKVGSSANMITQPEPDQIFLGTHPTPDPLAYLPPPTVSLPGTMTTESLGSGNKKYTLTPGRHSNLPQFNAGDQVVFKQASANNAGGVYYLDGGGFKSTGAQLSMDPNTTGGMMLYNQPRNTTESQKIQITGNPDGTVNLAPLTDGPYSGMMLWQDRNSPVEVKIEGNGDFSVKGTFYAAGALMNINGNGGVTTGDNGAVIQGSRIGSQYVSRELSLGGNGNIHIDYFGPDVARTRIIKLVE